MPVRRCRLLRSAAVNPLGSLLRMSASIPYSADLSRRNRWNGLEMGRGRGGTASERPRGTCPGSHSPAGSDDLQAVEGKSGNLKMVQTAATGDLPRVRISPECDNAGGAVGVDASGRRFVISVSP